MPKFTFLALQDVRWQSNSTFVAANLAFCLHIWPDLLLTSEEGRVPCLWAGYILHTSLPMGPPENCLQPWEDSLLCCPRPQQHWRPFCKPSVPKSITIITAPLSLGCIHYVSIQTAPPLIPIQDSYLRTNHTVHQRQQRRGVCVGSLWGRPDYLLLPSQTPLTT